jgi:hypothetical protein
MRYSLRTLVVLLLVVPPFAAWWWTQFRKPHPGYHAQEQVVEPQILMEVGGGPAEEPKNTLPTAE